MGTTAICLAILLPVLVIVFLINIPRVERIRERTYGSTQVINCSERYELTIPDREFPEKRRNQIIWRTKYKDPYPDEY